MGLRALATPTALMRPTRFVRLMAPCNAVGLQCDNSREKARFKVRASMRFSARLAYVLLVGFALGLGTPKAAAAQATQQSAGAAPNSTGQAAQP